MTVKNELIELLKMNTSNHDGDFESLADFLLENHAQSVDNFVDENGNNGLLFEICEFDGHAQNQYFNFFVDMFGVEVF